jgi:transposase
MTTMAVVAQEFEYVIGVDTHAATHSLAVVAAATGAALSKAKFPTSPAGPGRAVDWIARHAPGKRLVCIEGTGSYGATLTRLLIERGQDVCEVKPPARTARAGKGKTDDIDAVAAARGVLSVDTDYLISPRADRVRAGVRVLLAARKSSDGRRTADRNALTMLLRTYDLGVDARRALTEPQLEQIAAWRARPSDDAATATIRGEARRLARAAQAADTELANNHKVLDAHVRQLVPGLLEIPGLGPVTGGIVLAAWSHHGRIRTEAAFASLAGAAPFPASSGNTVRHRLSRNGDRQLNRALDVIARVRMSNDPATRVYVERRSAEGRTRREIRRCLKRYIARQIVRQLQALTA